MKSTWTLVLGTLLLGTAQAGALGDKRAWSRISDPLILGANERQHDKLPLTGGASEGEKYWSSDYWAKNEGGINYRWNAANPTGFNLQSPSRTQAAGMSLAELSTLAPTEKFDLFIGRYDYPLKRRVDVYANPDAVIWAGICDGWAKAALHHNEPKPREVTNPDGLTIPFGSSDIKALLSWYYTRYNRLGFRQMGRRCFEKTETCEHDMNAGAFHLVLMNTVGVEKKSFIADIERNNEVWNHLVGSYQSTVRFSNLRPASNSAPGTVQRLRVRTQVRYVYLVAQNTWEPVLGTSRQNFRNKSYEYFLELDRTGKIIGGEWISRERPDFLWTVEKAPAFTGLMARLSELLD
jgi:hypothetical protein